MRNPGILVALAGAGAATLLALFPPSAEQAAAPSAFDPLFARGANCTPVQAGRPVLLASLLQVQNQLQPPPTETRPF